MVAINAPETVTETLDEVEIRLKAEKTYRQTKSTHVGDYEAGWKAAKAYYEETLNGRT